LEVNDIRVLSTVFGEYNASMIILTVRMHACTVKNQQDLDSLCSWSNNWQLKFNTDKCKVMHIGHSFLTSYCMTDGATRTVLETVREEVDLGVIVRSDLKSTSQCNKAAAAARKIIGMVRRNFRKLDVEDFLLIYKTYIRPRLEFCIQSWSPYLSKDIETLERVQRTATRLVPQLRKFSYEERLQKLGLTTLKDRRQRGDMIEVFKLLEGFENVDYNQFFTLATTCYALRGHDRKLIKTRPRLDVRKYFFSQRVVNSWNGLPAKVVQSSSVNMFKNVYDKHIAGEMDT